MGLLDGEVVILEVFGLSLRSYQGAGASFLENCVYPFLSLNHVFTERGS